MGTLRLDIFLQIGPGSEDFICHLLEHAVVEANRNGDGWCFGRSHLFATLGGSIIE